MPEAQATDVMVSYSNPLSTEGVPDEELAPGHAIVSADGDGPQDGAMMRSSSARRSTKGGDRAKMNRMLQQSVFGVSTVDMGGGEHSHEEALKKEWCGLVHPDTPTKAVYDMIQLLIMLYLAWVLPTRLALNKTATGWAVVGDLVVDASVYVDIIMNMKTYEYDSKTRQLITDRRQIKKSYMKSWFFIDFFSVVPVDQVLLLIGNLIIDNTSSDEWVTIGFVILDWSLTARMLRLLRLLRLVKIKKLMNVDRAISYLMQLLSPFDITRLTLEFYFRMFFLLVIMLGGSHFLGCFWLMVGRYNVLHQPIPAGWMVKAYAQWSCNYDSIHMRPEIVQVEEVFNGNGTSSGVATSTANTTLFQDWMDGTVEHECPIDINRTRDFVACIGNGFDQLAWNKIHGHSCQTACAPIPHDAPHNVDCDWIRNAQTTDGGSGDDDYIGAAESNQYLASFYFALVTISTVGYGDISPSTPLEKRFVIGAIVVGAFMYAYIIGDFSNLIVNMGREKANFDAKMRSINGMLGYIGAPDTLRSKVTDFYEYKFANKEGPKEIFNELPQSLQDELLMARWEQKLQKVPFFQGVAHRHMAELCHHMRTMAFAPSCYIMEKGTEEDTLLILSKGVAKSVGDDETEFETGAFWGELQFLGLETTRTLTVQARLFCEVAVLAPNDIEHVLDGADALRHRLQSYGKMRKTIEDKMQSGEEFDMEALMADLDAKYKEELEEEGQNTTSGKVAPQRDKPGSQGAAPTVRGDGVAMQRGLRELSAKVDKKMATVSNRMDSLEGKLDKIISLLQQAPAGRRA
jgi:hypothetical protein